jgi:hypothetical protein
MAPIRFTEARFMEATIQALLDLEDDLHHDRRADWQTLNTVHHPHMTVFGAEELTEQIRNYYRPAWTPPSTRMFSPVTNVAFWR